MPLEPFAPLVSRLSTTISTPSDWSGHPRPPEPPLPANRPTSEGASSSPSSTGQGRGPSQHPHLGRPLYFQLNLITPYLLPPRPAPATPRARAAVARDGRFLPVFTPARLPSSKSGGETPLGWLTHDSTLTQVIDLLTYIPPTSGHILGNCLASEDLSIQGPTGSFFSSSGRILVFFHASMVIILILLAGEHLPFFVLFQRESLLFSFHDFSFCGAFLFTYHTASMVSSSIYRKHITSQHSPPALHKEAIVASTCQPGRDNASQQTKLARAGMSSSVCTARCMLETNEDMEMCLAYTSIVLPFSLELRVLAFAQPWANLSALLAFTSFLVSERSGLWKPR